MRYAKPVWLVVLAIGWTASIQVNAEDSVVDLFEAVDRGDVNVRFIPLNAERANVVITNQTNQPLQLRLPEAIAAVPILGQFGQNQNHNQNQNQGGGGSQSVGGGFDRGNGQGLGNGQNGFGMGLMRVAPGKTRKLQANTVCLEHGKPDPKPRIAYRMIPIESYTDDPTVIQVCQQLGSGKIPQQVAQAIVWHRANGLPWNQLADLNRMQSLYRGNIKYFRPKDLTSAKSYVNLNPNHYYPAYDLPKTSASAFASAYSSGSSYSMQRGDSSGLSGRSRNQSTCR